MRSVCGRAERGGTGVWVVGFSGADVTAGAGVRRRGDNTVGGTSEGFEGRQEGRTKQGTVVRGLRAVCGRVERGGKGVRVVGFVGADVAAGAGVRRCAGRGAFKGNEAVDRALVMGEVGGRRVV